MGESISPIAKDGRNMLAIFARVRSIHDAVFDIALAPIKDFSVVGSSLFDTGTSVEASVIVSSAGDVFDFALQAGVTDGTRAIHSVVVQLLFEG